MSLQLFFSYLDSFLQQFFKKETKMIYFIDQTDGNNSNDGKQSIAKYIASGAGKNWTSSVSGVSGYISSGAGALSGCLGHMILVYKNSSNFLWLLVEELLFSDGVASGTIIQIEGEDLLSSISGEVSFGINSSSGPVKTYKKLYSLASPGDILYEFVSGKFIRVGSQSVASPNPHFEFTRSLGSKSIKPTQELKVSEKSVIS